MFKKGTDNMKNKILRSVFVLALCFGTLLSCISCAGKAYACNIINDASLEVSAENDNADKQTIKIGDFTYNVIYDSSVRSNLTNDLFDIYGVVDGSSELVISKIRVDAKTGEIYSFSNMTPYQKIDNIDEMTDEALKAAVEQLAAELVDFDKYNTFEVVRPQSNGAMYYLVWQVQQELKCNNKVEIYITLDGEIKHFYRTEACPVSLTTSFITQESRNALLEDEICEYLNVRSLDGIEYEIQSETLSYYDGKDAIIYSVKIIEDGFGELISLVIY